jgi:aspartokinase
MLGEEFPLSALQERLQHIATVTTEHAKSLVSLIGANDGSCECFERVAHAVQSEKIAVQMISYGVFRLVVNDEDLKRCVEILHLCLF